MFQIRKLGSKTTKAKRWNSDRLYPGQGGEQGQRKLSSTTLDSMSLGFQVLGQQPLMVTQCFSQILQCSRIISGLSLAKPAKPPQATGGR